MIEKKDILNCIKRICLLLAGMQILLAGIWLCAGLKENPVCILTVAVALFSGSFFLKQYTGEWYALQKSKGIYFGAAYIVSFPVILHGHFGEWRYSLATSFVIWILACLKGLKKNGAHKRMLLITMGIAWFGAGVLVPAYGVLVGIVACVALMCVYRRQRIGMRSVLLIIAIAISGLSLGYYADFESGGKQRIQNSFSSVMLSRFAWPYFVRNSYFWEPEVREIFTDSDLAYISTYPEQVIYDFGPRLEAYVGKARAREIYRKMAWESFQIGKKEAILNLGRDLLANAAGPLAVQYQLNGNGISYTGMNYADMRAGQPGLTKYYVKFSMYSFDFMILLSIAIVVWLGIYKKKCRLIRGNFSLFGLYGIFIFWYSLAGNGMQDYLKILPVHVLWCSLPVLGYGLLNDECNADEIGEKE